MYLVVATNKIINMPLTSRSQPVAYKSHTYTNREREREIDRLIDRETEYLLISHQNHWIGYIGFGSKLG